MNKIIKTKGFTLIELMVVIVIIGILVAIALPNFVGAQDRAKISSVKANMHTFQVMLETYGVDHGGTYPNTMTSLAADAKASNYVKSYTNPFTMVTLDIDNANPGKNLAEVITGSFAPSSWTSAAVYGGAGGTACVGQVIYRRSLPAESYTRYTLYGLDKNAQFITNKGIIFVVSNN